jgi:hypothetical protein
MEAPAEIENIKKQKRETTTLVASKIQEALDRLMKFEESEQEIYVNGKAESIRDHCEAEKKKIKAPIIGQDNE